MTRLRNIIALTAFALMVLALPSVASAQWRDRDRNDDYYGNNRNNRNIRATIQNLKNRSRNFERRIERIDDRRDDRRDRTEVDQREQRVGGDRLRGRMLQQRAGAASEKWSLAGVDSSQASPPGGLYMISVSANEDRSCGGKNVASTIALH